MEDTTAFQDAFVFEGSKVIHRVCNALESVQAEYGDFHTISGLGAVSKQICEKLKEKQSEPGRVKVDGHKKKDYIGRVFVIDRTMDLLSPLMTQLTYEGIIDERIGIEGGFVDVPNDVTSTTNDFAEELGKEVDTARKRLPLFDSDEFYRNIRDLNFGEVLSNFKILVKANRVSKVGNNISFKNVLFSKALLHL